MDEQIEPDVDFFDRNTWLYSPGTNAYLSQMARYCSDVTFTENGTDIPITFDKTQKLIGKKYFCVKFPEIDTEMQEYSKIARTISKSASWLKHKYTNINANGFHYFPALTRYNLGQDKDIEAINNTYEQILSQNNLGANEKMIGYGTSRGAMALINWVVTHNPQKIKALVLEGTPSSFDDIIEFSTGFSKHYYTALKKILVTATAFKTDGPNAVQSVPNLPKDLPIILIASKADTTVPFQCSVKLYESMINNGFTNVQLVLLNKPDHNEYLSHNELDTQTYMNAVQDFYKKLE
jgi:hypothetical protein